MSTTRPARRVGLIGGGLIAQAVHLPILHRRQDLELVALADPSETVREGLARRYGVPRTFRDWQALLAETCLDAVVVCSPHSTHAEITLAAIELGVHVFVEKPLCIVPEDADLIARRARETGVVVEVGYMKRYDEAFDAFLRGLPPVDGLRLIDVVTFDPWMSRAPFVDWDSFVHGSDIGPDVLAQSRAQEREQVGRAVGDDSPSAVRAFSYTYLACLVHDVNLVHGVLNAWGATATAEYSRTWADGRAATTTARVGSGASWRSSWLLLPGQDEFEEDVRLYFDDSVHRLVFGVPYHQGLPTRHQVRGRAGAGPIDTGIVSNGYQREIDAFVRAMDGQDTNRTPPEQAAQDIRLLGELFRRS